MYLTDGTGSTMAAAFTAYGKSNWLDVEFHSNTVIILFWKVISRLIIAFFERTNAKDLILCCVETLFFKKAKQYTRN